MSLNDVVTISVVVQNPGVTEAGFGVPLIVSHTATWTEFTRTYTDITDVAGDWSASSPEYMAADAIFSQDPSVPLIMIGRASAVTQKYVLNVVAVANNATYSVRVGSPSGNTWVSQTASYTTAGSGDTNDTIVAGLIAALTALATPAVVGSSSHQFGATATGSTGSHQLQILAAHAGDYFAIEVLDRSKLGILQTHSDTTNGMATDLENIADESNVWYGLLTNYNSAALVEAAAGWVETNVKLYTPDTCDTSVATQAYGTTTITDVAQALQSSTRTRTGVFFHPSPDDFAAAAQMGVFFPVNPGGDNWRMKPLDGPVAKKYKSSEITNMKAKFVNFYYNINNAPNGQVVGGNGKVASGEYIDVIRGDDWYAARLQTRIVDLMITLPKIPFDDDGITAVAAQMNAQNKEGISAGLINPSPAPTMNIPLAANVSPSDKANRALTGLSTSWELAGAINTAAVTVQVSF